jgi:hypothetical protein
MKKIIFIFIFISYLSFSQETLKDQIFPIDSIKSVEVINTNKPYPIYLIGGLGLNFLFGNQWQQVRYSFRPLFNIGLEIPFTRNKVFSLEVLWHTWFAKYKYFNGNIVGINDYSGGLSFLIKNDINLFNNISMSFSIGWLILDLYAISGHNPLINDEYDNERLDLGVGLNYKISKDNYISLSLRALRNPLSWLPLGSGSDSYPNLLILNYYFNFR